MRLRRNEYCPIHRSRFCCGWEPLRKETHSFSSIFGGNLASSSGRVNASDRRAWSPAGSPLRLIVTSQTLRGADMKC